MKKFLLLALLCVMTAMGPMAAEAAIMYGHEGGECNTGNSDMLYLIDTVAQTVTPVGADPARFTSGPEIQIDPSGTTIYMSQANDDMFLINPATGLNTGSLTLSNFPADTNTATALEFVGNTLYGSFHAAGPESGDGILGTINTTTGAITTIGQMTGMNRPTGGLSYVGSTMYAVASTDNNDSRLFTVNLTTGAATLVGNITLSGVQQEAASALAYADGTMYTVLNCETNNLYSINLATGALTVEFNMGVNINSLTALPSSTLVIPLPHSQQSFSYAPIALPVKHINPANAKPIGIGSIATGGDMLDVRVGFFEFESPVNLYAAYIASTNPQTVNVLNPSGSSFSSFTIGEIVNALSTGVLPAGAQPWKASTTGPINVNLLGTIQVSTLPSGTYTAYLLVTPAGSLSSYYLWMTSFVIP